jgi:thermostable 8-oxoguanine DNA glycosylase
MQLSKKLIRKYSGRTPEKVAFKAGKRISKGDFSRKNLKAIVKWKLNRAAGDTLDKNPKRIESSLKCAVEHKSCARKAIKSLMNISGVGASVASAIMTTIDAKNCTIIDSRAIESLKLLRPAELPERIRNYREDRKQWTINEYLEYLKFCIALAKKLKVDLRSLDKALWQYSYENSLGLALT